MLIFAEQSSLADLHPVAQVMAIVMAGVAFVAFCWMLTKMRA